MNKMRLKIIACEVLFREICLCAAYSKNVISTEFMKRGLHDNPDMLRSELQERIDNTDENVYEGILLGYALCSNGVSGVRARGIPLIIPKAHDCVTLFLGSRENYDRQFTDEPGTYYYTHGWLERAGIGVERKTQDSRGLDKKYAHYVEKYGEDNAKYLMKFENSWIENYSRAAFINLGFVDVENYRKRVREIAAEKGWKYEELPGDMRLIKKLIDGEWDAGEFLIAQPGKEIVPSYDNNVIKCRPAHDQVK
jgi:hypothetical protein